jgi:hypothetical protein
MDTTNRTIASRLDEVATLLQRQGANPFRVEAYHRGATTLRMLQQPVAEILEQQGLAGLDQLPNIGESLARSIATLLRTGSLPLLERLRGDSHPEQLLMTIPGIGLRLSERLHDELGIDSLEELELAAHDGRLHDLAGFAEKRLAAIRDVLSLRLGRLRQSRVEHPAPAVAEILSVDQEYREGAAAGRLRRITPRRFNPHVEAWLPILHTQRGDSEYTALFSNTAMAHRLNKTRDWVVIYQDAGQGERSYTVVSELRGSLKGLRVVRGLEAECERYYRTKANPAPTVPTPVALA